jgi:ubiquinone/menaquinone biosynthesis C-methylase UbiE
MAEPTEKNWKESWQDENGQRWVRNQARTDAQLNPLSETAVDALRLSPGESVLDVGCGTGQTLLQLRERVGEKGRVVGLDISPPLLEFARARVAGFANIELLLGDAAKVLPQGAMDALFSRFGVMFFDEPQSAFRHLRRALRPKGRVSFLCWQGLDKNPWAAIPLAAVKSLFPELPKLAMFEPMQPGPFRFQDPNELGTLLTGAGFAKVEIAPQAHELVLGGTTSLEEATEFTLEIGPAARTLAGASSEQLARAREILLHELGQYLRLEGVVLPAATFLVTAERAD